MAGLRNGGVDTSRLSLPGYAGVELVVGGPRLWDPDTGIWYPAGTAGTPGAGGTDPIPGTPPVGSEVGGDSPEYDPDGLFGGTLPATPLPGVFNITPDSFGEDILPLEPGPGVPPFAYRASYQGRVSAEGVPLLFTTVTRTDPLGSVVQHPAIDLVYGVLAWEYDYVNEVYSGAPTYSLLFDAEVSATWTTATVTIGALTFDVPLTNIGAVAGFTNAFNGGANALPDPPNAEVPGLAALSPPFAASSPWTIVLS